jgi:chromosome partitioning protein
MYDGRTKLASAVIDEVRTRYSLDVIDPPVPKSIRVAEAPGRGKSVLTHAPSSKAAEAYRQLAKAIFE